MTVSGKTACYIALGCVAIGGAIGRYSLPAKVVTTTVIQRVVAKDDHSTTITTHKPDGTVVTVVQKDVHTDINQHSSTTKTTERDSNKWSVRALMAVQPTRSLDIAYGLEVDYRLLGPLEIGAFGLTNGVVGVGLGLRF